LTAGREETLRAPSPQRGKKDWRKRHEKNKQRKRHGGEKKIAREI